MKTEWNLSAPIRMLTVTGINLVSDDEGKQLSIFDFSDDSKRAKWEKIEKTVDEIRHKNGKKSISLGTSISSNRNMSDDNDSDFQS